jgi:hypothetical protein
MRLQAAARLALWTMLDAFAAPCLSRRVDMAEKLSTGKSIFFFDFSAK